LNKSIDLNKSRDLNKSSDLETSFGFSTDEYPNSDSSDEDKKKSGEDSDPELNHESLLSDSEK
jgi:hypothetical protein